VLITRNTVALARLPVRHPSPWRVPVPAARPLAQPRLVCRWQPAADGRGLEMCWVLDEARWHMPARPRPARRGRNPGRASAPARLPMHPLLRLAAA
jgi:hypothetical protein